MKVRAVMQGTYGNKLRQPGEEFELLPVPVKDAKSGKTIILPAEDQFSHVWMMVVDGSPTPLRRRNVGWDQTMDSSVFGTLDGKKLDDMSKEELVAAILTARAFFNMKSPEDVPPAPAEPSFQVGPVAMPAAFPASEEVI